GTELGGSVSAVGEDEHIPCIQAVGLDPIDHRFDQCRALAGARSGQHTEGAATVFDDLALSDVQHRRWMSGPSVGGGADKVNRWRRTHRTSIRIYSVLEG